MERGSGRGSRGPGTEMSDMQKKDNASEATGIARRKQEAARELIKAQDTAREVNRVGKGTPQDTRRVQDARAAYSRAQRGLK